MNRFQIEKLYEINGLNDYRKNLVLEFWSLAPSRGIYLKMRVGDI